MDTQNILTIAHKELRDSLRNRWFLLFTLAFAGLALALSLLAQPSGSQLRMASYSRTAASLINLVLLFVPLIGLTVGASGLANDRETGTLSYLLAQPVNHSEVLIGKYLGMGFALLATLVLGFGLAGIALALQGQATDPLGYLSMVIFACLLALGMLSLGFLLATLIKKATTALTSALLMWLLLVFVGDLGIMGASIVTQMPIHTLFWVAVINPLQMYKMAAILNLQANLEVLGPVGMFATEEYGTFLLPLLIIGLVLWIVVPLALAMILFNHPISLKRKQA